MTDTQKTDQAMTWKDAEHLRQKYWVEGLSLREIAEKHGTTAGSIHYQFEKHEIPTRTSNRDKPPSFYTDQRGYERIVSCSLQTGVHRLAAVAWFGWEAVVDKEVHHHTDIPWDNREKVLEPMTKGQHTSWHNTGDSHV